MLHTKVITHCHFFTMIHHFPSSYPVHFNVACPLSLI